jgi:N-acetylglucosaminyldiphosphoundecaprenol N-acetyl-beta-D-mannosaminyltransferase
MSTAEHPLAYAATAPTPVQNGERIHLGRLAIDTYSREALLQNVIDHALHGDATRQIVTANAQFYVLAEKNARFRACLDKAEYSCADGMPVVWACKRLIGTQVPRIAGVDLIEDLCRAGASRGLRLFLLGGVPGSAKATAALLAERYPGVQIAGISCPPYHFEKKIETLQPVLDWIAAAKPHILLVALGAPKQEFFIDQYVRPLRVPIAVGIGGSFEILSGGQIRAPKWMQSAGLEWLFRLRQEPRRLWKRYLIGNAEFVMGLVKWWVTDQLPSRAADMRPLKP